MAPAGQASSAKRKRVAPTEKKVTKRPRAASSENEEDPNAAILLMEQGILESRKNYNNIAVLLGKAATYDSGNPEAILSTVALCRIFMRLLAQGSLVSKKSLSEKDRVVVGWLREQFSQFKDILLDLLGEDEIASTALTLCMRTLKAEGEYLRDKSDYAFPRDFLGKIVKNIIASENDDIRKAYIEESAEQYDDVRYYTFASVTSAIKELSDDEGDLKSRLFESAFALLTALDGVPESADELEDFYIHKPEKKSHYLRQPNQHKKQGQEAWLALMNLVETNDQRKRVLALISDVIAPWFPNPEILSDFLTSSYDASGSMALLALSGVFYLIRERNLDYPSFYPKLYSLLNSQILHSKYRARFFRLLDTFLSSTHLPVALVASFLKRLARLSLNAPPSAIAFVIPWIYNMLMKHPLCTFMLQRETTDDEKKKELRENGMEDPFLPEERDPMKTSAIESSFWELVQLQSHYHPNIATIAKIVAEQFTKHSYNMEDFLDHSYASLLEAEMGKDVKKAPVVEFHIPKKVFLPQEEASGVPDSLLVKLWDFETVDAWWL
ncbi:nucleolar complex protein 4 [Cordyceps fumosorosea ARSEF 2679]|uniref:Nucleolar complex protein 4 n=1 Tax=Cordyceps fumosorosea (strain ARSEF 2679) TaxID=1081104 RepID=A0A167ZJD5_CORFA|nr:nucleolar complex protein 4 [Cordyceps fumosorosea ARSEF 2679]OAA67587.1 nucleolar complex protein 4 [Cordyceps fumosorosea ARSEF 2679]